MAAKFQYIYIYRTLFINDQYQLLQPWLYYRERLKYVWNVYCVVTDHIQDLHTTATTGNEPFPIGHGTNYFHFVLIFSLFISKQLLFLPICLAKNTGLSDFAGRRRVASRWLLNFFFLNSNDYLDAVLSTDVGEQRCFKFLTRQFVSLNKTKIICSVADRKRFVACGFCGVRI